MRDLGTKQDIQSRHLPRHWVAAAGHTSAVAADSHTVPEAGIRTVRTEALHSPAVAAGGSSHVAGQPEGPVAVGTIELGIAGCCRRIPCSTWLAWETIAAGINVLNEGEAVGGTARYGEGRRWIRIWVGGKMR